MQNNDNDMAASVLNANSVAFIGLCREYCEAVEHAADFGSMPEFVNRMIRLLPRIYISALDLKVDGAFVDEAYVESLLDEDYYETVRRDVEALMGEEDVYLEVFEEDMKYSDTPVSASISEGLADIFQVLYNFTGMIRGGDITDEVLAMALVAVRDDFHAYWSTRLCNVMRALNRIASESYDADAMGPDYAAE